MKAATTTNSGEISQKKPSVRIVERIADLEETDPTELTPPLYSVIDLEAVDALFHTPAVGESQTSGRVRFSYNGYDVCVRSEGEISISEA